MNVITDIEFTQRTGSLLQCQLSIDVAQLPFIMTCWQQTLPHATFSVAQQALLVSLWQHDVAQRSEQLKQAQSKNQPNGYQPDLRIWHSETQAWLLISWWPEWRDLTDFWLACQHISPQGNSLDSSLDSKVHDVRQSDEPQGRLSSASRPTTPLYPPALTPIASAIPAATLDCRETLTLAALCQQFRQGGLAPCWFWHNLAPSSTHTMAPPPLQLTHVDHGDECHIREETTAILVMRLTAPQWASHWSYRLTAISHGLCVLEIAATAWYCAGPCWHPRLHQACLLGLAASLTADSQYADMPAALNAALNPELPSSLNAKHSTLSTTLMSPPQTSEGIAQRLFQQLQHSQFELHWLEQIWSKSALCRLIATWQFQIRHLQPGQRVGIDLCRGPSHYAAYLACLFYGLPFIPLDRQQPEPRLVKQLQQSQVTLILTDRITSLTNSSVPCVYLPAHAVNHDIELRPLSPEMLAYMLFTSGSTGQPKAVRIQHAALATFFSAAAHTLPLQSQDLMLAHTSVGFDISLLELWLPLYLGCRLELLAEQQNKHLTALPRFLQQITVLQGTPTLFRTLISAGWQGHAGLTLLVGGEAVDVDLLQQLRQRSQRLLHCYGPTEATIWSMMADVSAPSAEPWLGPSLVGYHHRVIDTAHRPVHCGMIGELCIASDALSDGYEQQPDLTVQRFYHDALGQRWYKTGDLVRRLPADRYQFMGRIDHQIKLHGYRIELQEIESVLRQHTTIADCAVVFQPTPAKIVAFVVPQASTQAATPTAVQLSSLAPAHADREVHVPSLHQWLQQQLPHYMQPHLIWLSQLPLTISGKVDRVALHHQLITTPAARELSHG